MVDYVFYSEHEKKDWRELPRFMYKKNQPADFSAEIRCYLHTAFYFYTDQLASGHGGGRS